MPLADSTLQSLGNHLAGLATHAQLHTADPHASAGTASLTTAARQPITWTVDADGDLSVAAAVNFTGVAANGAVTHVSLWSAITGGTYRGSYALTGDQTANAAGEYSIPSGVINGTGP